MRGVLVGLILFLSTVAHAQEVPVTRAGEIAYATTVEGELTDTRFFEQWRFDGAAGDSIRVLMRGDGGLAPLVGLLDGGGDLIATSADGAANGSVELRATLPADGAYLLVATRVGNQNGSTTGRYTLTLQPVSAAPTPAYDPVTFRCDAGDAVAAVTIAVSDEGVDDPAGDAAFEFAVFGIDGFEPVFRVQDSNTGLDRCITDDGEVGDVFTLPDEPARTLDDANASARLRVANPQQYGTLNVSIGNAAGATGRYLLLVWGVAIQTPNDADVFEVRLAPRAAPDALLYALALNAQNSRLDPTARLLPDGARCDDAGRRGCEGVSSAVGVGAVMQDISIAGDRFDAGVALARANVGVPILVEVSAFNGGTTGDYALVVAGGFPAGE